MMGQSGDAVDAHALISTIYDCALRPDHWTAALADIATATQSTVAAIDFQDFVADRSVPGYEHGYRPGFRESLMHTYARVWALQSNMLDWPVGKVMRLPDILPVDEFLQGRFYREWVKPQEQGDYMGMLALKDGTKFVIMSLARDEALGPYPDEAVGLMTTLAPHIAKSVAITDTMQHQSIDTSLLAEAIQTIGAAVFLLRANGDIAFMNRAAEALAKEQTIVRVASGRLAATDAAADGRLRQAIAANAQPGGDTGGEDGADTRSVVLPSRTGDAQVAHVLPLNIGGRYAFPGAGQAAVAVFVRDPARPMPVFGEALAAMYSLTRAEVRVAVTLAQVQTLEETSSVLGLSPHTVRTHLKNIFEKTGVTRQAELMALVFRLSAAPVGAGDGA
ncbi:MAG: helix-turn-helix transcriptional regulator [Brucellaceae bacterium]|nr:helix-turn-helix transcriptional regulator [Brucellaceae bacterium]